MRALLLLAALVMSISVTAGADSRRGNRGGTNVNDTRPASDSGYALWNDLEQPGHSVVGYLGVYYVPLYPLPMTIGSDFRMMIAPEWALRGGFLYWTASGWATGTTASLFDVSVGAGHVWTIKRVEIEGGGRLGYDMFKVNNEFDGWDVFGKSGNSIIIAPYASGMFKFTKEWSVGVQARLPFYLKGGGLLFNQPYILSQGSYSF